ncbi:GNAT family N-acetyltransferase [Aeromicrobium sp.]|uniref:GNAT family N-acetyltransferase n=1 Tax=Aeromicrobium sp. TaxID=1871063 RepID=UPI003510DDA0
MKGWPVELSHGDVGVRPLRRSDARAWARLRRADVAWLSPWEATLPPGGGAAPLSYRAMIVTQRRRARQGRAMPFVVTWRGEMVGQVTVNGISWGSARWASIGYWIARRHAGRGITPVAVALVVDHLLDTVGLHRVEISIRPENEASLRVVHKLGLDEVGLARGYLHIDGAWRDHRVFQVLADDRRGRMLERVTRDDEARRRSPS